MLKVYCYSRCSTCKKALKWLEENGIEHTVIDIKENNPTEEDLRRYRIEFDRWFLETDLHDSVYVAGAKSENGRLLTSGGRVLGVTAVEGSLKEAVASAYAKVEQITFGNAYYRRDIGARALAATEE